MYALRVCVFDVRACVHVSICARVRNVYMRPCTYVHERYIYMYIYVACMHACMHACVVHACAAHASLDGCVYGIYARFVFLHVLLLTCMHVCMYAMYACMFVM